MSTVEKVTEKVTQQKNATTGQSKSTGAVVKETTAPVVYIGPTIPGIVMTNTLLKKQGTELAQKCEKMPELNTLLVPVADLAKARKELETEGTPANICYKKAVEHLARKEQENGDV